VAEPIKEYVVSLVEGTRAHEDVALGASPRGSLALYNTVRAWAAISGRDYVVPDDVKLLAEPALAHRVIVNPSARIKHVDSRVVVADVLARTAVPGAQPNRTVHGWT
jgi:MoxR-like ATPase